MTDSASCNVNSRKKLTERWTQLCFVACFCDQLKLMAGNMLTYTSAVETAIQGESYCHPFQPIYQTKGTSSEVHDVEDGQHCSVGDTR